MIQACVCTHVHLTFKQRKELLKYGPACSDEGCSRLCTVLQDRSDTIDVTELSAIMKTMGMKLSQAELDKMMRSVDVDGSGEIDFKEFCQLLGYVFMRSPLGYTMP
jgi:hypothetical protein